MATTEPAGLLTSKLGVQARGRRYVDRERLRSRLGAAREARLVLVSAPAGFGKSTLLAEWLRASDARSSWLTLDARDNDVVRFARYLGAAASRLGGRDEEPARLDPGRTFDAELAATNVLETLARAGADDRAGPAVLVLDDYHLIEDVAAHHLVGTVLERLPPGVVLGIATRADPPLPLARLRARGELLEIRAEDLRFTAAEAAELLRSAAVDLAPDEVEELTERTEGWAAALRLAAISLQGRSNQPELVRQFGASHRFVLDYVVDEVLAGLPPAVQEFLLRTSILERLTGSLCDAVTGERDGQARLEELDRANLLIVPLDDERRWYRYHALFADILRARLAVVHPEELPALHARASAWHEDRMNDDEAIAHALHSGDVERMGRVVSYAAGRHLNAGELSTVRRWLDMLPAEVVHNHAQLSAAYAWCLLLVHQADGVAGWLDDADRAMAEGRDGGPEMRRGIPPQLAMLRSQLAGLEGDHASAVEQARLAVELVPDGLPDEADAVLRGTASVLLALALIRDGDTEAAMAAYEAGLPGLRAGGNVMAVGRVIGDLALIAIARGDAAGALRLCESELERGDERGAAGDTPAVWASIAKARVELGQIEAAEAAAHRALDLALRAGDAPIVRYARSTLARIDDLRAGGAAGGTHGPAGQAGLVEPLTERELEVLRLVALGRSNSRIAAELFVTVGTVKSHVHAISGKLGAANRVEAVARGRELGLLD